MSCFRRWAIGRCAASHAIRCAAADPRHTAHLCDAAGIDMLLKAATCCLEMAAHPGFRRHRHRDRCIDAEQHSIGYVENLRVITLEHSRYQSQTVVATSQYVRNFGQMGLGGCSSCRQMQSCRSADGSNAETGASSTPPVLNCAVRSAILRSPARRLRLHSFHQIKVRCPMTMRWACHGAKIL
jgi:hypothetical protein